MLAQAVYGESAFAVQPAMLGLEIKVGLQHVFVDLVHVQAKGSEIGVDVRVDQTYIWREISRMSIQVKPYLLYP